MTGVNVIKRVRWRVIRVAVLYVAGLVVRSNTAGLLL